jgi:type I restriction-modification system DNA methylase subunit
VKRPNRYGSEHGKEAWNELENIGRFGYGMPSVFQDFLDLTMSSLLSMSDNMRRHSHDEFNQRLSENHFDGEYEKRYMDIVEKYKENKTREIGKRPADFFANAWGHLWAETTEKQMDILGAIYMDRITHGEHGQFYTPDCITDLMADITITDDEDCGSISDCACGSGRTLISAAKKKPHARLYGTDIDQRCAKMAALNMWMLGFSSEITWGNTISMEEWATWKTLQPGLMIEFIPKPKTEKVEAIETISPVQIIKPLEQTMQPELF